MRRPPSVSARWGGERSGRRRRRRPDAGRRSRPRGRSWSSAAPKGQRQTLVGAVVLGHHQQAGGVLVQAVDDARPLAAADARQVVAVLEQGVDQGAGRVARGRMDDEAGRLLDDEQVGVLEDDVERDVLGRRVQRPGRRLVHHDAVAGLDPVRGLAGPSSTVTRSSSIRRRARERDQLGSAGTGSDRGGCPPAPRAR